MPAGARLNSETAGSMIDRMSILALKVHAMRAQTERTDVDADHVAASRVKLARLEQQDVALEAVVGEVALQAELEARVQQGPEDLVQHHLEAAVRQVAAVREVGRGAVALGVDAVEEGSEGVVADDQVRTLLDRDVDAGGGAHAAVHVVDAVDARGSDWRRGGDERAPRRRRQSVSDAE